MGRGDPKSGTRWPGRKSGTGRPGQDVLVCDGGPGDGLASHLLLPHDHTHPWNLLDFLFYNIKYFKVPKICILTSWLQVTSKRTKLYCAFWRKNSRNHFKCSALLAAPLQHGAESVCAAETAIGHQWWPGYHRYHILQRVSGHWSLLIQIATYLGSRLEKSEFQL